MNAADLQEYNYTFKDLAHKLPWSCLHVWIYQHFSGVLWWNVRGGILYRNLTLKANTNFLFAEMGRNTMIIQKNYWYSNLWLCVAKILCILSFTGIILAGKVANLNCMVLVHNLVLRCYSSFFRNSQSWDYWHFRVTSNGNKLSLIANQTYSNTNLDLSKGLLN